MFPFPQLPTDHLYKLSTFAGIAMILGAFYLMAADTKPFEDSGSGTYSRMTILIDRLKDVGLDAKPLADNISGEDVYGRYREYRDLIRTLPANHSEAKQLRDTNEQLLLARLKNRWEQDFHDFNRTNVYTLLYGGLGLLFVGIFWWYWSFQRYQDIIVRMSAIEAINRASPKPPQT
ncbi:hypothetical protein NE852_23495 [Rhizobium sp. Pop5]|uniref:hypothetical protein n=1 Tax=Rhizobium sp. Pop5 TaxID=1223565 RepID=UPI0002837315|nr:hypothetical protein [Rhizobium sp. Pop5]EJZ22139.1 hypothetical protein RCCGEPOP_06351 [Rhizobium sp. Pop5]UVD56972.1 hypothetical protein NE852_23495 [Rhizobium sp. Pop5]